MFLFLVFAFISLCIKWKFLSNLNKTAKDTKNQSPEEKEKKDIEIISFSVCENPKGGFKNFMKSHSYRKEKFREKNEELLDIQPRNPHKLIILPPPRIVQNPPKHKN